MTNETELALMALIKAQNNRIDELQRGLLKLYDHHIWLLGQVVSMAKPPAGTPSAN